MKLHRVFFFLLIFFLPTQLGYHFWPDWTLVLGRRVDYLSPTIFFTDVLVLLTLFFWAMEFYLRSRKYELRIKEKLRDPRLFIIHNSLFIILVGIFIGINICFAGSQAVAISKWVKVLEFVGLGYYIVKTKPSLSIITFFLSFGVLYSSALAIIQFYLQHSMGGLFWFLGERTFTIDTPGIARIDFNFPLNALRFTLFKLRPYATFPHPNVLGGFLAPTLPLVIIQLSNNPIIKLSNGKKIFYLFTTAIGFIALLLTFSRSAIIVGAIAIVFTIARIKNYELRIKKYKYIIFGFILLLTSCFMLYNSSDESVVVREELNTAALKIWEESPLFGAGLGNFLVELPKTIPTRSVYFLQPVHNIFLLALAEVGLVGLGIIGLLIFLIIKKYELGIKNHGKKQKDEKFLIHTSLFIILLLGLIDHYPLTLQQGQLLLTLFLALGI